jgi:peptidoglycan/LPS O-acetylase OafA/YrhL
VAAVLYGFVSKVSIASPITYYVGITAVSLCAAVLIAALLWAPPPLLTQGLQLAPLRWVGRISYGVYLWHIPVIVVVYPRLSWRTGPKMAAIWLGALALGALSHYAVERPFLRLKERLGRGRRQPVAPAPSLPMAA